MTSIIQFKLMHMDDTITPNLCVIKQLKTTVFANDKQNLIKHSVYYNIKVQR